MQLNVKNHYGGSEQIVVDRFPDLCPNCHRAIAPVLVQGFKSNDKNPVTLSFYCPRHECSGFFVGQYQRESGNSFYFEKTMLGQFKSEEFSDIINTISPDFIQIYNQARSAEQYGLNQICGVGFRKALEFLMKDYIISKDNSLRSTVEKLLLGKCINEYIEDVRIKSIAKRATWLGNDETHYVRKWVDKDISDLKLLIDLAVHWIETEALTERMIQAMPE